MDVAIIVIQVFYLLSSFGVIAMTFYVYKLSRKDAQIDNYLKQIIDLYYTIEDASKQLNFDNFVMSSKKTSHHNFREIKVNCSLMIYYMERYPGFYSNRNRFVNLLNEIIEHPEKEDNYDYLSNLFSDFCQNIKKDSKGENYHLFVNGRENGYPEKDN